MRKKIIVLSCILLVLLVFSAGGLRGDSGNNGPPPIIEEEPSIEELARSAASNANQAADALDAARETFMTESKRTARARGGLIKATRNVREGFARISDAIKKRVAARQKRREEAEAGRKRRERSARDTRLKAGMVNLYVLKDGIQASSFFGIISNQYKGDVLELPVQLEHDPGYRLVIVLKGEAFEKKAVSIIRNLFRGDRYIHIKSPKLSDARFGPAAKYKRWSPVSWTEPCPDGTRRLVIDDPDFINTVKQTWFIVNHEPEGRVVDLEKGDSLPDWYSSPRRPAPQAIRRRPSSGTRIEGRVGRLESRVNNMAGDVTELRSDVEKIKKKGKDVVEAIQELTTTIRARTMPTPHRH